MRIPTSGLKLMVGVPAVVASTLLWATVLALMPPALGTVGFLTGLTVLVLLSAGAGEQPAVRLLTGARTATAAEQAVLAPVLARTELLDARTQTRRLLVRQNAGARTPLVHLLGRGNLVVTPWLIEATYRGWLRLDETTALIVHAAGRHRAERHRCEVAMLAWTLPWRAGAGLAREIGRIAGGLPLIGFAWAFRGVIGVVAIVQQIDEGRPAVGIMSGSIVALTYLIPAATKAAARRVEAPADEAVVRHGLGGAMATMLRRYRLPVTLERLYLLEVGTARSNRTQKSAADRAPSTLSG